MVLGILSYFDIKDIYRCWSCDQKFLSLKYLFLFYAYSLTKIQNKNLGFMYLLSLQCIYIQYEVAHKLFFSFKFLIGMNNCIKYFKMKKIKINIKSSQFLHLINILTFYNAFFSHKNSK